MCVSVMTWNTNDFLRSSSYAIFTSQEFLISTVFMHDIFISRYLAIHCWRIGSFRYHFLKSVFLQVNVQATVSVEMWYSRTRGQTVLFLPIIRVRNIISQMQHTSVSEFLLKLSKVNCMFIATPARRWIVFHLDLLFANKMLHSVEMQNI